MNNKMYSGVMTLKAKKLIFDKYSNLFAGKGDIIKLNVDDMMFTNVKYDNYTTFESLEPNADDFELIEGDVTMKWSKELSDIVNPTNDRLAEIVNPDEDTKLVDKINPPEDNSASYINPVEDKGSDYDVDYDRYNCTKDCGIVLEPIKIDKETLDNFTKHYGDVIKKIRDKWNNNVKKFNEDTEGITTFAEYADKLNENKVHHVVTDIPVVDPEYVGKKNDMVNHPAHYTWLKDKCGVEVIDITRHMDFSLGNAFKYLLRAGYKRQEGLSMPDAIKQDLRKAIWYIEEKINNL